MQDKNIQHNLNQIRKEGEDILLSKDHLINFEDKLKKASLKKRPALPYLVYKIVAVLILGLLIWPTLKGGDIHPDYTKYKETKSYFTSYIEYEIGINKEKINEENKMLISSSLKQVQKLQNAYVELEKDFINLEYDKRILKRMIDNFRQQLDILENIDALLESSKPNLKTDEDII